MQAVVTELSRETPVLGEYEVVVLGGGPAGIAAAVTAARVTGACFVMGQAAGAAADLAQTAGCAAADVDIHSLQARLESGGAYLGRQVAARRLP